MKHSGVIPVLENVSKIRATKKFQIATRKNESEENEKCFISPSVVLKNRLENIVASGELHACSKGRRGKKCFIHLTAFAFHDVL